MLPFLRIYDLSIINYLKYEVLPLHFTERVTGEALVPHATIAGSYVTASTVEPAPTGRGRGWTPFDEVTVNGRTLVNTTAEQTAAVTVYGASSYDIDYPSGRIVNPNATPTSVDYNWNYVSVIEGWPGVSPPPLPVVAVDVTLVTKEGYQLGGGTKDTLEGSVYVFATSEAEKKDVTDVIYQSFYNRTLPIRNWHEGSYLNFDGTYSGFAPTTVSGISSGAFLEVVAHLDGPRMDWSELNRHRSRIRFVFEVYKDD